ncbi:hypothetical protein BU24DRAFT_487039 [Aaosphaeria arxii CBS 175.79]|uniref:DUF6594 domain-containing protein n=1 Tax=Aaosphaeria arxii CBS 175.79 TaxID=1450172 RepID=A0A6A5Y4H9_9PLEO|nr:uncharacterized protein BU24DRAFT_487039 [Aaosphaeria arxii CBS 175.79]KAF2020408.1 hypothetical protein BU24DRAFT_487039 [Aaosphaeria arxii CBS 175.79]
MAHDEEKGLANVDVRDYAAPNRQGTFIPGVDEQEDEGRYFPPSRVGTGVASTGQPESAPGTRPTSAINSLNSNATGPRNSRQDRNDTESIPPGTRPNSLKEGEGYPEPDPPIIREDLADIRPDAVQEADDVHLGAWLVNQFKSDLFHAHWDTRPEKDKRPHLRINLAGLNRMRMRKLQVKLAQQVIHMRYHETEPKGWEDLLSQYIKASKDSDYIRNCVNRKLDDPFVVISERWIDAQVFKTLLDMVPPEKRKGDKLWDEDGRVTSFAKPVETGPEPIGGTRAERGQKQRTEEFFTRLAFSVIGGIFLVAPMWLMVLHNTRYTALVTTSVAVLLWGMASAWKLEGGPLAVLSTTAAYAAVLVVFVGTNTSSQ